MPNLVNYVEEFLNIRDLFDTLTVFSTGYLLMMLFDDNIKGFEERQYHRPKWKNEGDLYYEQVIFAFFFF